MSFKDYTNYHEMLCETIEKNAEKPAFRWFDKEGNATSITWKEFYQEVKDVSKSLMALGVEKEDKVNILSYTCYRWMLTDISNMCIGAGTVGIYQSNLPADCEYIINHSDAVVIFAQNREQLDKLFSIRDNLENIKKVILFNGDCPEDEWVISFEEFLTLGQDIPDSEFEKRTAQTGPDDTAGIVYTSGTTGVPKGVVLTQDNITYTAQSVYNSGDFTRGEEMFVFLPLAHVFARTCCNTAVKAGHTTSFARSIETLMEDFQLAAPNWFVSVPRIFEKIHTKIISNVQAKGGVTEKLFHWSCAVGSQISEHKLARKPIPFFLGLQYKAASKIIFSKIHNALGGRVEWCISGAAPLNPDIARFFHAAGLLILEGVGMTENTSFSNVNRPDNYNFGVVGPPGEGLFHKISEEGELLTKGRNTMKEYYKMPGETAETFTEDGWLKTGDIGEIDENNVLKITGRQKDLIITAGGKNISPSRIEGIMTASKYINQICIVGDRKKYLSALATLDEENTKAWADKNAIKYSDMSDLLVHPDIIALINKEVDVKNRELPSFETLKKVTLVPEFTIENSMITPTFKLKKNIIIKNYNEKIESMYDA
ncbi:MAG: long-chain fatty acid--CoA ligase [Desulfobacteraceae bacterium]